jgi:hypothetical protein
MTNATIATHALPSKTSGSTPDGSSRRTVRASARQWARSKSSQRWASSQRIHVTSCLSDRLNQMTKRAASLERGKAAPLPSSR